ncbi:hypothetical protein BN439_3238 [Erwinia amylovora Ea644]|nr:hypothetical protein BN439_3238 [Erwinia amylovora Ea644]CCP08349.1 hypothetical protein BN440_3345 [Erwinia amylovora MR1]
MKQRPHGGGRDINSAVLAAMHQHILLMTIMTTNIKRLEIKMVR